MSVERRLWRNPIYAWIFLKYLLVQTVSFKSEKSYETPVLALRTRRISNLLISLPLKRPFNARSTPSTCRSQTLSRLNRGTPRSNIICSNTIWRMARWHPISPIAAPVQFGSMYNLVTWGIPFALHVSPLLNWWKSMFITVIMILVMAIWLHWSWPMLWGKISS